MSRVEPRENFPRRRIPSQNIVHKLIRRELCGELKPGTSFRNIRSFHTSVVPDFTIINVEKPPCFLRKFSPDGRHFIAFSADQTSVEIYHFRGSASLNYLLQITDDREYIGNKSDPFNDYIRFAAFETLFSLKFEVRTTPSGEQLNRECSLFTDDGKYIIVGSASYIPDDVVRPHFYDIYTNNEAVTPNPRSPLEDYSLHLIDLVNGQLTDSIQFKVDKIYLSHNQGLYLYKDTLAVLSVQHQMLHIFHIQYGKFVPARRIGRYCYDDDDFLISQVYSEHEETSTYSEDSQPTIIHPTNRPFRDHTISGLKNKILIHLYWQSEPRIFYQRFDQLRLLRMWKMQLLDEEHLLIRYASEDVVTLKAAEPCSHPSFFVVYNIVEAKVLAVYENTSQELLFLLENYCDYFRNAKTNAGNHFMCSPSNNLYARLLQQRFKQTIMSAKYGGSVEATRRMLAQLPISAQSYSSSPYLDLSLFSYDDKWVSAMERPKACGEHPIRFYARDSGLLKFRIWAGSPGRSAPPAARRLVAFTFHPTEPFGISVQRTNSDYVVNFHMRFPK
ncbi:de-etiolated protein 1 abo [Rhodnius prolixus]|uniref:de-etiolated protein 1 abo n=1 Tax=Rhodnius prolixus TaxID=13249 RepID=UPI003D188657